MKRHLLFIIICYALFATIDVVFGQEICWVKNGLIIAAIIAGAKLQDLKK
jgi:hypothetical protein